MPTVNNVPLICIAICRNIHVELCSLELCWLLITISPKLKSPWLLIHRVKPCLKKTLFALFLHCLIGLERKYQAYIVLSLQLLPLYRLQQQQARILARDTSFRKRRHANSDTNHVHMAWNFSQMFEPQKKCNQATTAIKVAIIACITLIQ